MTNSSHWTSPGAAHGYLWLGDDPGAADSDEAAGAYGLWTEGRQFLEAEWGQKAKKAPETAKAKAKLRASVVFGRQKERGGSRLKQEQPKARSCFAGCFGFMASSPVDDFQRAGSRESLQEFDPPQEIEEMAPVPQWEEVPSEQQGIVKLITKVSTTKEDTPNWRNQDTAVTNAFSLGDGGDGAQHLFVGVFDGHGKFGHEVSQCVGRRLPAHLAEQAELLDSPAEAYQHAVLATDDDVYRSLGGEKVEYSGSTCVAVLVDQAHKVLHVSNVGDSRAVVARRSGDDWESIALTRDLTPDVKEERDRIKQCGGIFAPILGDDGRPIGPRRIWDSPKRVKPGIGMTRSIGDGCARSVGVIADPVVTRHELSPDDKFMLVASDGLWDSVTNDEAVRIVGKFLHLPDEAFAQTALFGLQKAVRDEEGGQLTDDTTIVIVVFK